MNAVLEARDLVKEYRIGRQAPIRVLDGVSFAVAPGERVAIVGRSGAGKSTLLNLLGGLDRPTSGSVVRPREIGFVFQSFHLMPELDIVENVMLASWAHGRPSRARACEVLERVGLGARLGHLPAELSGGEQQRVAVARALVSEPSLVLADEPTGNLDALTGAGILDLLFAAGEHRPAVIMVTHAADAAAKCDRALRLENGHLSDAS